jgi:uncharacterized phage protein (TIGR01671 family)
MNREIKFRAYDKERKKIKFFDLKEIYADCYHNVGFLKNAPHEHENDGWEQFELMQFTGLLDKNGKEIYEGDIVEYIERLPIFPEKRLSLVQFIGGNVDYANNFLISPFVNIGSFNYETNCITGTLNNPKESIVIGNIYENPELLTEK